MENEQQTTFLTPDGHVQPFLGPWWDEGWWGWSFVLDQEFGPYCTREDACEVGWILWRRGR